MFKILSRLAALAALSLMPLALLACGESSQDKAKAQVCAARKEISTQIAKLEGLSISANLLTEAKTSVEAIQKSVTEIKEAQPKLEPAIREQVEAGTTTFQAQMATIAQSLAAAAKLGNLEAQLKSAGPQVKAALTQLANGYKQAYASLKC